MNKVLRGVTALIFILSIGKAAAAQDSKETSGAPAVTKTAPEGSHFTADNQEKSDGRRGQDWNAAGLSSHVAVSINSPKETVFGMDPTIALFVVISMFLVLVVAIIASSNSHRSDP